MHVVIGIIQNADKKVLVSRRKSNAHLGGLLEFPGGKVEKNESPMSALRRELKEELHIQTERATPLIQIPHIYSDRNILLDVFLIETYSGSIVGNEGQEIYWKDITRLSHDEFPAANYGLIRALQLPNIFPVTPNYSDDPESFLIHFEKVVSHQAIKIIQLRSHDLDMPGYIDIAKQCVDICGKHDVKLILNRDIRALDVSSSAGLHLTSEELLSAKQRPVDAGVLVGASCHNANEIEHANNLRLDYLFLGPVLEKNGSDNTEKLDWDGFAMLARNSAIPVYAIGGLNSNDMETSIRYGGQGFAAIREFWGKNI